MNWIAVLTLLVQLSLFVLIICVIFRASPRTLTLRLLDQIIRNASGAPVTRLSQITPQLYVGGQHHPRGWAKMQALGITAIVNLREAHYDDKMQGIAPESAHYLHLPTRDGTPPTMEQLHDGVAFIQAEIAQGGCVYIHCASGFHRAPTLATAYFISTGLTLDESLAKIKKVRPFARPIKSQKKQLAAFAAEILTRAGHEK